MMSRSLYENIPNKQNMNELQRELKGKYVPRGSADAIPPTPLCKSRLQIFGPERTSRLSLAMKMSGGLGDQISTEQAVARNSSPALTTATLSPSTSSRLRPASIVKPYRAVSPSLRTTGHQLHNRSPPVIRPRTIMPTHSITSGPQQADSQPSSPMRYVARLYSQNLLNLQPPRDNNAGNNLFRPAVDQAQYTRRVSARSPMSTRSVSSSSDSSSRFPQEHLQSSREAALDSNSSTRFQCAEPNEVSREALRCLETRLHQLVMSKKVQDCPRDSSSDYDTASVSIKPPEVPTRTTASRRDVSPNVSQRKALSTPLPVLKLRDSHQCVPNIDNGPVSESDSSASLQDFSYEELRYLLKAVHNMLAMQSSLNLDSQPERPLSWYVAANRSSCENAYQLGSAGGASPKPPMPPPNTPKSLSDLDFDVLPLIDAEDFDLRPRTPRARQSAASTLLPPVLPAGFRNFSRYLDTKFGPDSSSVSLESIIDPQVVNDAGGVIHCNVTPTADTNLLSTRANMVNQERLGRQQARAAFLTVANDTSPGYYSDNVTKSWSHHNSAPVAARAPRQLPTSAHEETDFVAHNRRQEDLTSPLTNERCIRTGSSSPNSSYFSDWPQNGNVLASTPAYDLNVSCVPLPSHDLAWSDYRSRAYWSTPQFLPYAWNAVPTPPPPPPPAPLPPPTIPLFPSWFPFTDYFGWRGPPNPYGPHPHVIPPLVSVLPHQRPTFNPAADWFRAAANHFAAAAMFAERQMQPNASGQTDETVQTTEAVTAAADTASFDNGRLGQTSRYTGPVPHKYEVSRIPAKIKLSAASVSVRPKPQVAVNGTLIPPEESALPGSPRRRVNGPTWSAPSSPRSSESPITLPDVARSLEDSRWTGDFREWLFEDLELPQDPALILPDYLDFYTRIKVLLVVGFLSSLEARFYSQTSLRLYVLFASPFGQ
uniref:Uncharacterized protein n=1 Tax=Schistocephalus solidus TaxID=70667 RepID=A0A0X3PT80_SCHSO